MVNGLDLKLIQSATNTASGFNNTGVEKNETVIYAKKGEPMYQKEMDADEDGVITLEEFRDYCKEHDISVKQQQQMLRDRLNYQLQTERVQSSDEISQIRSEAKAVYAKEGDDNYKEEIDSNADGKITYDEYMKYCEEQKKLQETKQPEKAEVSTTEDQVVVKNEGKLINQYAKAETDEPESKVEKEI